MIKASFLETSDGVLYGYEFDGHAGYAEEGTDIVCAACSVLAINTANALEKLVNAKLTEEERDGYLKVEVLRLKEGESFPEATLLLEALKLGLSDIKQSYGSRYVQLKTWTLPEAAEND